MVSTTPRNNQDWGGGGGQNTVICLNIVHPSRDFHCLCTFTRAELTRKVSTGSIIYIYILVKEEPYTAPLGMDFQLNLPKPVKK